MSKKNKNELCILFTMSDILPSDDSLRYKILNANPKNENRSYFNNKLNN